MKWRVVLFRKWKVLGWTVWSRSTKQTFKPPGCGGRGWGGVTGSILWVITVVYYLLKWLFHNGFKVQMEYKKLYTDRDFGLCQNFINVTFDGWKSWGYGVGKVEVGVASNYLIYLPYDLLIIIAVLLQLLRFRFRGEDGI